MAQTLTTKIQLLLSSILENNVGLAAVHAPVSQTVLFNLASGTGANQADRIYTNTLTLAGSATNELDLAGVLTDIFGAVVTFARVKAIVVIARSTNVNNVVIGGAAVNAFVGPFQDATDKLNVRPGGMAVLVAPDSVAWAVTAGTADKLLTANGAAGTDVVFDLIIIGASA